MVTDCVLNDQVPSGLTLPGSVSYFIVIIRHVVSIRQPRDNLLQEHLDW